MPDIIGWPAGEPLPDNVLNALEEILDSGNLVVYPTNTLYGLGASIRSHEGISRIYRVKKRPSHIPLTVMATESQICEICRIPEIAGPFLERHDTRITAILPANDAPERIQHDGTIAVRLPCSELTESMVEHVGPVTATSANIHGKEPPSSHLEAMGQLGDDAAIYIDSGPMGGKPTTIIDFTGAEPKVIREGYLSHEAVSNVYG